MRRAAALLIALAALAAGIGGSAAGAPAKALTCPKVKSPKPRTESRKKPKSKLDAHKAWTATVVTSCGTFTIKLAVKTSPHTTASFVSLARSHFFDNTIFHRVVPGFVIQGGDPTATGTGGPGYTVVDTPAASTKYPLGTVAMAKAGNDPAGLSGSQFFVVTGTTYSLQPLYAVLGHVAKGLPVAFAIGRYGDINDPYGKPTRVVVIRRITISSS
ncbi:MAG TPA: peptidylprolyl isomerase [Gaiellaceae bacterium]|nr:peptidylprolyl isomerase [Gaiellaceae bacterium]